VSTTQRQCPDEGACHHDCGDASCWRVTFCEPLSSYGTDWTDEDRAANANPPAEIESLVLREATTGHPWANADGFIIRHHRATDTLTFGPFDSLEEVDKWVQTVGNANRVAGVVVPCYRDVDWSR